MLKDELEKIESAMNVAENLMYVILDFTDNKIDEKENEFALYELQRNAKQATKVSEGVVELLKNSQRNINKIIERELKAKVGVSKCI